MTNKGGFGLLGFTLSTVFLLLQTLVVPNRLVNVGDALLVYLRQTDITLCHAGVARHRLLQSFTSELNKQVEREREKKQACLALMHVHVDHTKGC